MWLTKWSTDFHSGKDLLRVGATSVTFVINVLHALRKAFTFKALRLKQGRK